MSSNPKKYEIIKKRNLTSNIKEICVYAPLIAKNVKPGQFVIVMSDENTERIPLTIIDWSKEEGWIKLVFQEVGASTIKLGMKNEGDSLYYIAGPLGNPSKIEKYGKVIMIGGGVANAALYPIARELKDMGNYVTAIIGARTAELLIYEKELKEVCSEVLVATDDGSKGFKGYVSELLDHHLSKNSSYEIAWIIGPAPMMKACSEVTKKYGITSYASLNSIMVCGVGMCGACRIKVGDKIRYTCFEGPEFDAHRVDWNELLKRLKMYSREEKLALDFLQREIRGV